MSERIVDNPANHGWVEENGKWVWDASGGSIQDGDTEGQITTWDGSEWTPEGAVVVNANGVASFKGPYVTFKDDSFSGIIGRGDQVADGGSTADFGIGSRENLVFCSGGGIDNERMRIDANGNVGIGVQNPNRVLQTDGSQVDFSRNGKKLEINPNSGNADTHSTIMTSPGMGLSFDQSNFGTMMSIDADGNVLIGTDTMTPSLSGFGQMAVSGPSGGAIDFQVNGTSYGRVICDSRYDQFTVGATQTDHAISFTTVSSTAGSGERMRIDANGDATFSGTVIASSLQKSGSDEAGIFFGNTNGVPNITPMRGFAYSDGGVDLGNNGYQFQNGYFRGTVTAGKFVGDGSGLTGISAGGNYVPLTGNSTVNGTITATDFIATSDERLKEDISPLPVGLIDDIKPVQWNWKDGSGKSAGVIAQQLQAIGLEDFVNEDEDGNLGVNYNALVGVLLAEVINLKAEVESLK